MKDSLLRGDWAITTDELLTWKVMFARDGTLPMEAQRRLLGAAVRAEFRSHGVVVTPIEETTN